MDTSRRSRLNEIKQTAIIAAPDLSKGQLMKEYKVWQTSGINYDELSEYGFKFITGLDPSSDLLKAALDKHVYINLYHCFMTEQKTLGIESDYYDGLTTCGCLMMNHLPVETLDEMIRVVKSGGLLVITTRHRYLSHGKTGDRGEIETEIHGRIVLL